MKAVLLYTSGPDVLALAPIHYPAHKARLDEFHARGALLMVGTFADPVTQGSMGIFASREDAEAFVEGDPFLAEGVVSAYEIRDWNEILV